MTVTKAVLSGDLRTVRLFWSLIGDEERQAAAYKALEKASGFVRSRLASALDQKHTPRLIFERDLNPEYAQRINEIISLVSPQGRDPDGRVLEGDDRVLSGLSSEAPESASGKRGGTGS